MGFAIAAVAAGAVVAAGSIAADEAKKGALKESVRDQLDALDSIKGVDISGTQSLASQADKDKYAAGIDAQKATDPTVAALRSGGASNLLSGLTPGQDENQLLSALQKEGLTDSPQRSAIIDQLFAGAQKELSQGATLDPSFEAELVRSGLEQTGQAGISADYKGAAGVSQRTLLGSAGIALQQQRTNNAQQLVSLADQLKNNRAAILANTLGQTENVKLAQQNRAAQAFQVGQNALPNIGLGGSDVANLSIANLNQANNVKLAKGQVLSQGDLGRGALTGDEIKSGASFVSSAVGGMGGGGGGGSMRMISGLMGSGGGGGGVQGGWQAAPQGQSYLPTNWQTVGYV